MQSPVRHSGFVTDDQSEPTAHLHLQLQFFPPSFNKEGVLELYRCRPPGGRHTSKYLNVTGNYRWFKCFSLSKCARITHLSRSFRVTRLAPSLACNFPLFQQRKHHVEQITLQLLVLDPLPPGGRLAVKHNFLLLSEV